MPVKIRLQRKGRRKRPFYHIVIADSRAPRDGRFIENIGSYNPMTSPATVVLDTDKALDWLNKGAQPTDTMRAILRFKGVLYKKHLQRGVKKGALTQEQADSMFQDFISAKDTRIEARIEKTRQAILDRHQAISGTAPAKPAPVAEEATEEVADMPAGDSEGDAPEATTEAAPVEEATAESEAPVAEEAPVDEADVPATEEAPAADSEEGEEKPAEGEDS